jgi:hypothetical protein
MCAALPCGRRAWRTTACRPWPHQGPCSEQRHGRHQVPRLPAATCPPPRSGQGRKASRSSSSSSGARRSARPAPCPRCCSPRCPGCAGLGLRDVRARRTHAHKVRQARVQHHAGPSALLPCCAYSTRHVGGAGCSRGAGARAIEVAVSRANVTRIVWAAAPGWKAALRIQCALVVRWHALHARHRRRANLYS